MPHGTVGRHGPVSMLVIVHDQEVAELQYVLQYLTQTH